MVTLKKETEDDTEIKEEFVTAIQNIEKNLKSLTVGNLYGQLVKNKCVSAVMKKNIRMSLLFLP